MKTPDDLLDDFDAAWARVAHHQSVEKPQIQDYCLAEDDSGQVEHFENLVEIDLEYRWQQAFTQLADSFDHETLPSLADYVTNAVDPEAIAVFSPTLVAESYQLALRYGRSAMHSEYLPFANDKELASQLLCEVDATREVTQVAADTNKAPATDGKVLPTLPDFEFETVLGRGGKGIVYKARQISIDRTVAIKTLRANGDATANDIRRLRNEAKILGSLHHPNIVTVYSLEQVDDQCFLVMEYVSGSDLSVRQQSGDLPVRDAARFIQAAADAIQVAHEHKILHRDIKPSNILLDDTGAIRVTDFGLSRRMQKTGTSSPITATTEVLGTPGYISPEQARGQSRELDETADVYGLGATLYSLLVGIAPFTGQDVISILQQVCERVPTPPRMLQPDIPRDLETICMKCLEKRSSDRYSSAKAVSEDLGRFLRGEPIQARPTGVIRRAIRWCQLNTMLSALLCTVVLLALSLAAFFLKRGVENANMLAKATQQRHEFEQALQRELAANEELYDNQIRLARLEYDANELGNAERILESLRPTHSPKHGPPWEWKYLWGLLNPTEHRWDMATERAEWIGALAFSPDGRLIAIGNRAPNFDSTHLGAKGRITIRDTTTGDILKEISNVMSIVDLQFTDDATALLAIDMDMGSGKEVFRYFPATVRRWNTSSWNELPPIPTDSSLLQVHPTTKGLLAISLPAPGDTHEDLLLLDVENGVAAKTFNEWQSSHEFAGFVTEAKDGISEEFRVTRTGLWISGILEGNRFRVSTTTAETNGTTIVSIFRKPGGELVQTMDFRFVETMAFDREEQQIAIGTNRGEIHVWNTETWIESPPLRGHTSQINSLAFSPDGSRLASGDWNGIVRIWDLAQPPGAVDTGTPVRTTALESFALNSDGQLVSLVFEKPLEIFEPGSQSPLRSLHIPFPEKRASPGRLFDMNVDGTLIAEPLPTDNTVINILSTTNGTVTGTLPAHGTRVSFVRFFENSIGTAAWKSGIFDPPLPEDGEIRLSDLNGEEIFFVKVDVARVHRLALSRDGSIIAASLEQFSEAEESNCIVRSWNVATGKLLDEFPMSDWTLGLEFNPTNDLLAAIAFESGDLSIRDVNNGITVAHKPNSVPEIQDLGFSPDGQRLAGVTRRQLILWNPLTHRRAFELPIRQFSNDPAYNARIRFSSDGSTLMVNQPDATIRSWRALNHSR